MYLTGTELTTFGLGSLRQVNACELEIREAEKCCLGLESAGMVYTIVSLLPMLPMGT